MLTENSAVVGGRGPLSVSGVTESAATFESLFRDTLPRAYRAALHMTQDASDAEDVVQEAALLAFRAFATFRAGTNFRAWFLRILTNVVRARYRKAKRSRGTMSLDATPERWLYSRTLQAGYHREDNPAQAFMSRLTVAQVREAIDALPSAYRTVVTLYFVDDLSYEEIAGIVDCPVGTVRSRLHRGRKLLQDALWQIAEDHGLTRDIRSGDRVSATPVA